MFARRPGLRFRNLAVPIRKAIAPGFERKLEFDPAYYRETYGDIRDLSDRALRRHFLRYGMAEGRLGSRFAARQAFRTLIDPDRSILEIGPFTNPFMRGANVRYFDVLDTRALLARAIEVGYAINNPPHIDYVSADGDLSIVRDKFHAVVSSHVIEHQPDLVSHLLNVERLLHAGGAYFLVVPDQRYCFDYPLELSQEDDVVRAYVERRRRHTLDNVVRCRARTTHNDAARHWNGDHFDPDYSDGMDHRQRAAVAEHQNAGDRYVDVHAWQFTPSSFFRIIDFLYEKRLIRLVPSKVFNTPRNKDEFCAILTLRR